MRVSIIIPVYKVEPYIERCIHSVLNQTYRDIEVILVDDCSPDNSMTIAKKAIEKTEIKDLSFVFLNHDNNRGLSVARNTGINAATGEYVYFLDSDDAITPNCIEKLVEPLSFSCCDFVIGDVSVIGADKKRLRLTTKGYDDNPCHSYYQKLWFSMAVNKLVGADFIRKHNMYFKEGLIHEDELWSFQLACKAKALYAVDEQTYIYYVRPGSIMTVETREASFESRFHIAPMMWEYLVSQKMTESVDANNIIEVFLQAALPVFVFSKRKEDYKLYMRMRNTIRRSKRLCLRLSMSSASGFSKYFHYLLPAPLGFVTKAALLLIGDMIHGRLRNDYKYAQAD